MRENAKPKPSNEERLLLAAPRCRDPRFTVSGRQISLLLLENSIVATQLALFSANTNTFNL